MQVFSGSQVRCGTCINWNGTRELCNGGASVRMESMYTKGNCPIVRQQKDACSGVGCKNFVKWSALK